MEGIPRRILSAIVAAVAAGAVGVWVIFRVMAHNDWSQRLAVVGCCAAIGFALGLLFKFEL
jgi:hypothetical protein